MNSATTWTWVWWTGAALIGAWGLWLALRGLFHDPGRRTRRCPRCWYGMTGVAGTLCPECGRDAGDERRLLRRRRRWRKFAFGTALAALAALLFVLPNLSPRRVVSVMPWTAVILLWPDGLSSGSPLDAELERVIDRELRPERLWSWQRRMLARRCGQLAEEHALGTRPPATINLRQVATGPLQSYAADADPHRVLSRLGADAAAAVPALGRAARAGSVDAMRSLERMGPLASAASPDLIAIVRGGPQPQAPATTSPLQAGNLTDLFDLSSMGLDEIALGALIEVDTGTEPAMTLFRELATEEALRVPLRLIVRFGNDEVIHSAALAAARAEIEAALARGSGRHARSQDSSSTHRAVDILACLGPGAPEIAPLLGRFAAASEGSTSRWRSLDALATIGPAAAPALPDIEPIRRGNDPRDKLWSCFAVASISRAPADVDALLDAIDAAAGPQRRSLDEHLLGVEMLGRLHVQHDRILHTLVSACEPDWILMERSAPAALGTRASFDPDAVDALVDLLSHRKREVRISASLALGSVGAGARTALPALEQVARDQDVAVARAAATSIESIRLARPQK